MYLIDFQSGGKDSNIFCFRKYTSPVFNSGLNLLQIQGSK